MSEHDKIRKMLALAAAVALTTTEEEQVAEHVRSCVICSDELEIWQPIVNDLCQLPAPHVPPWLVQATLARVETKLAEQTENDGNRMMIFAVTFAWLLTIANWVVFQILSGYFESALGARFGHVWIIFAAFTALGWLAGGVAAVMLVSPPRSERRMV